MTQIKVNIHSFIDVITNSSTEIFVDCHGKTIDAAKDLINQVLKIANSDKTADDLFDFKLVADCDYEYDTIYELLDGDNEDEKFIESLEKVITDYKERFSDDNKRSDLIEEIFNKINNGEIEQYEKWGLADYDWLERDTRTLIITSKTDSKEELDLLNHFSNLFNTESYNG